MKLTFGIDGKHDSEKGKPILFLIEKHACLMFYFGWKCGTYISDKLNGSPTLIEGFLSHNHNAHDLCPIRLNCEWCNELGFVIKKITNYFGYIDVQLLQ